MRSRNINKDGSGNGAGSDFINRVLERLQELQFYDSTTIKVEQTTRGARFHLKNPIGKSGGGGFAGEYDQSKSYDAGQTFKISKPLTIYVGGVAKIIVAGYYGVRESSTAVDSQTFGPWAGQLPANPASSGIDMNKLFFNPELGLPSFGSFPNDRLYAELIIAYC